MACERLKTWAETSPIASSSRIPVELLQHASDCPFCSAEVKNLKKMEQAIRAQEASPREIGDIKKNVFAEIERLQDSKTARFNVWTFFQSAPAFLACVILVFMAMSGVAFYLLRGSSPHQELIMEDPVQLSGAAGVVTFPDGRKFPVSLAGQNIPLESHIALPSGASCSLQISSSGSIHILGNGDLVLKKGGFFTKNGIFVASFFRTRQPFKIFVPQAILGIRGTKIAFNLSAGVGSLELLEGVVEVQPEKAETAPFSWNPGEKLRLEKNGCKIIAAEAPLRPTPPRQPVNKTALPSPVPLATPEAVKNPEEKRSPGEQPGPESPALRPSEPPEEFLVPSEAAPLSGTLGKSGD